MQEALRDSEERYLPFETAAAAVAVAASGSKVGSGGVIKLIENEDEFKRASKTQLLACL